MSDADLFEDGLEADADEDFVAQLPQPARRRGRPVGAVNRKTVAIKALYQARGFRDPLLGMGELVTADPVELWHWMRQQTLAIAGSLENAPTLMEVMKLQQAARAELAPFLHGKAPIRIESEDKALPVLIVDLGSDAVTASRRADGLMSIGMREIEENQGVDDDED